MIIPVAGDNHVLSPAKFTGLAAVDEIIPKQNDFSTMFFSHTRTLISGYPHKEFKNSIFAPP